MQLFGAEYASRGEEVVGDSKASALAEITGANREVLVQRVEAAYSALVHEIQEDMSEVAPAAIAAIGFCLGGMAVLDAARVSDRSMQNLTAVASFHGILDCPSVHAAATSAPGVSVLAAHGDADPMVPHEDLQAFMDEMRSRQLDWQLLVHGGAMHAFTRPDKCTDADAANGLQYNEKASNRSWDAMLQLVREQSAQ